VRAGRAPRLARVALRLDRQKRSFVEMPAPNANDTP